MSSIKDVTSTETNLSSILTNSTPSSKSEEKTNEVVTDQIKNLQPTSKSTDGDELDFRTRSHRAQSTAEETAKNAKSKRFSLNIFGALAASTKSKSQITLPSLKEVKPARLAIENQSYLFEKGFDLKQYPPFFMTDPKQILGSFRSFDQNQQAGKTKFFSLNGVPALIPDLWQWAESNLLLDNKEAKEMGGGIIFSSWLLHTIETTLLNMTTFPIEAYGKIFLLTKEIPTDVKIFLKDFLSKCIIAFDSEKSIEKNVEEKVKKKKNFIFEAFQEKKKNGTFNLDASYLDLLEKELKNDHSIIFEFLHSSSLSPAHIQADQIILRLHRYYLYLECNEKFPTLKLFRLLSMTIYSRAHEKLQTEFPQLYGSKELKLKNDPSILSSFLIGAFPRIDSFQITHNKQLTLTSLLAEGETEAEDNYGYLPVIFSVMGQIKGHDLYSATLDTKQFVFNDSVSPKKRLEIAMKVNQLCKKEKKK